MATLFPFLALSLHDTVKKNEDTDFGQFLPSGLPHGLGIQTALALSAFMFIHAFFPLEI